MSDLEVIKELEILLNFEFGKKISLQECNVLELGSRGYVLNDKCEVISVSFYDCNIDKLYEISKLLSEFRFLTKVNFLANKISDISPLKTLPQIEELELSGNQIVNIECLEHLQMLSKVGLLKNKINDISTIKKLNNIKELSLGLNSISDITGILHLTNIKFLDMRFNNIKIIPNSIINFIQNIVYEYKGINEGIFFEGNPLESPPISIVKQGKAAIKQWFEQQEKYGKEIVYEAKILIVGEPDAGKTTLMKKLLDSNVAIPDKENQSTLGVNVIRNFKMPHPQNPDIELTVNIWDFGGQEIQYMLHQYFLTQDAQYIVVSDHRKENTRFDYWFQMIEMLGTTSSRIMVLKNRFKGAESAHPFARVQYRHDFPNLKIEDDELDLSETNEKWDNFRKKISESLIKLPVVGQENIKAWNRVRQQIEQKIEPYIGITEFYKMARTEGMDSDSDIELMLDYFRKIGVVVYFAEDSQLASTVFLNPNWITQAIYAALSIKNVDYTTGCFNKQWLFDFWQQQGYNKPERGDLLKLMQKDKFDICYPLPTNPDIFMVPLLLKTDMPENAFEYKDMLQLRYAYEGFMPFGIMSRLIVRLHKYIYNQTVWQRGAILVYENHTKAEINFPYGKNEIQIKITGKQKKEFRAVIKSELDTIVSQFPYIPKIQIPCICATCRNSNEPYFHLYSKLIDRREKGIKKVECNNSYQDVDLVELINGIDFTDFKRLLLDENFDDFFNLMKSKFAGISYQTRKKKQTEADYQEKFHLILKENGLDTEVEHATSDGRIDNVVRIASNLYIFECKTSESAQDAINQINEKEYALKFQYDFENIYIFGVKFGNRNIEDYKYENLSKK